MALKKRVLSAKWGAFRREILINSRKMSIKLVKEFSLLDTMSVWQKRVGVVKCLRK